MPDRATHHIATTTARCYRCGGRIDPGSRMVTTVSGSFVTSQHETCTPDRVPSEIFGVVQTAIKAAKELA